MQTVANNTVASTFKDATLKLQVTPQITAAGHGHHERVARERVAGLRPRRSNGIPAINTQRALTTVQVNDGATTVIGGIFVSQEQSNNDRTPVPATACRSSSGCSSATRMHGLEQRAADLHHAEDFERVG